MNKKVTIVLAMVLIGWSAVHSQFNLKTIAEQFNQYNQFAANEKLFAHTDKNFYLAGEIVWFKLYYVDGNFHRPLDLSKIAYVEILDKDFKPVLHSKISLTEGSGDGSLYLPVTINSGVYRLRAYTQWMKNFSADYFFEKPLTIVNSMKSLEPQPQPQPSTAYDITFFPEGGNLVQDIESKLAFRVADRSGNGSNYKGVVINQNNDTAVSFQPLKFGIGHCVFTPKAEDTYKAVIKVNDTVITSNLPGVQQQGYTMSIIKENDSTLRVRVNTNIPSADIIHLFVHTRQVVKISASKSLANGVAEFHIDKAKLGEGVSHFTIFNNTSQPVCERLYFIRPVKKLILESSATQQQFSTRSKVGIQIQSKDEKGNPAPADLSVAVYKVDEGSSPDGIDIANYLWLTSELRGNIESPAYYFSEASAETEEAMDNLMLTHGWRRFVWKDVVNNTKPQADFIPEYRSHIVAAKVINTKTGLPAPGILVYFSVPGKRVQLYGSKSDEQGKVKFYTRDFYGPNEILLQTDSRTDTSYRIEILSPFSEKISTKVLPPFELPAGAKDMIVDQSVSVQVQNTFAGDKLKQYYSPDVDSSAFYGPPDNSYMLDEFVRFSTMEEVLREYVVEVLVRRQKEDFRLMIAGGLESKVLENKVFMDDPLTLFNGVPVFEVNKIMQYDPLKVQKIDVIKRRYFYGPSVLNGIVNFTTYQPDPVMLSGLKAVAFDYEGIQFEREFYSPVYKSREQIASRLPDFRNVLYWSPNIITDKKGKTEFSFYTSDQKGQYIVVLQGMNQDGKIGGEVVGFTVK
jgi:hypothetical protein